MLVKRISTSIRAYSRPLATLLLISGFTLTQPLKLQLAADEPVTSDEPKSTEDIAGDGGESVDLDADMNDQIETMLVDLMSGSNRDVQSVVIENLEFKATGNSRLKRLLNSRFDDFIEKEESSRTEADLTNNKISIAATKFVDYSQQELFDLAVRLSTVLDNNSMNGSDPVVWETGGIRQFTYEIMPKQPERLTEYLLTGYQQGTPRPGSEYLVSFTGEYGGVLVPYLLDDIRSAGEGTNPPINTGKLKSAVKSLSRFIKNDAVALREKKLLAARERNLGAGRENLDPKYVHYAERIFKRSDKNGDGLLTLSEMENMLMNPSSADADGDEIVTLGEYAAYIQLRDQR